MRAEQLLAHFDRISDAPDAVPRLRRFILDLAVRGKLVEQDSNDERAEELLNRIEAEKARLFKQGELKRAEKLVVPDMVELPDDLPPGWKAVRLGSIAIKLGAGSTPLGGKAVYQAVGVPFLRSQNVHNAGLRLDDIARIPREIHNRMSGTHVQRNDILLNITGASIGRCALVPDNFVEGNVSQHVAIIRLCVPELREFVHLALVSPFYQRLIDNVQVGVSREGLSMQRLRLFPMLLPPLAEQRRIVAKVDELMALCDQFEAAQAEREGRRDRLAAASLDRLNNGADAGAFREHARFHLRHLPRLATRPEHIKRLRQTILNLAIRGRLVPQDPNDEPVRRLLAESDQCRQAIAVQDRRADPESQSLLDEVDKWQTPPSWEWRALADIVLFIDYRGKTPKKESQGVRLVTAKNIKQGFISDLPEEFISEATCRAWMTRGLPQLGDLLFTTEAPLGNAAVIKSSERIALAQRAICFRPYGAVDTRFLMLQLLSPHFQAVLDKTATGLTAKGIKAAKLKRLPVAIPPHAEQRRIVVRVDELLALCDLLEATLATRQAESRRLLEALLLEALAPSG